MTTNTAPAASKIVALVPAGPARRAADELAERSRAYRSSLDVASAEILESASAALHEAGWNAPTAHRFENDRVADLAGQSDEFMDAPGSAVYLPDAVVETLLLARGWQIEPVKGGGNAYVLPGRKRRAEGGAFATDYLWDRDDAMRHAFTAEAFALGLDPRSVGVEA